MKKLFNNKYFVLFIIFSAFTLSVFTAAIITALTSDISNGVKTILIILIILLSIIDFIVMYLSLFILRRRRVAINRSFDKYVEESIANAGVGVLLFNESTEIIWTSNFIEQRLNKEVIGKKLHTLSPSFEESFSKGLTTFNFDIDQIVFQAQVDYVAKKITIKDVTNEDMVLRQYVSEKSVVGELEIDNINQLQITLSEDELFKVRSSVTKMLDTLAEEYNIIYRQYVNGKYLIFMDQKTLSRFMANRFNFLDTIRSNKKIEGVNITASIGIGYGSPNHKELTELARDGLKQALARGGDQVATIASGKKPEYFGSKTEIEYTTSRVKIKQTTKVLEDRLKDKKISKVVIYGHIFADLDAVGSALGIHAIASAYGKEAYIQNDKFDDTTWKVINEKLSKETKALFIKPSKATRLTGKTDTLVVIVDTAEMTRIENERALEGVSPENIFIFDHHRVSKLPENVSSINTYIDTTASSASEIVTEILQFSNKSIKFDKSVAQMLLNGIYLDTKQFTKSVSSRTFAAASFLEKYGASAYVATDILKLPEKHSAIVNDIIKSVKEIKPGYFLSSYAGEVPQDVISFAADEILRVQGRRAAFVIARIPNSKEFKLSARGINTNVQVIAEAVGGGGHFGASAAVSSEPLPVFEDNVIQAIVSKKGDE